MIRILLSGCCGTMGRVIAGCAAEQPEFEIAAGIDIRKGESLDFPVYANPENIPSQAGDVLIDFSHPSLLDSLLNFGLREKTPLVLCTTGYNKQQVETVTQVSGQIPIFFSGNMSLGINLLIDLSKRAAKILGNDFDVEIIEKHHNKKIDAPSGTALMIADGISAAADKNMEYVYDRHSRRKAREKGEIGIHSIRGGTIVGEHEVIFAGPQETITIHHSAQSKEIFAMGALHAAAFLKNKVSGLYSMSDLLNEGGT